jgi:DNA-binding NarL/FixJ family response regulator
LIDIDMPGHDAFDAIESIHAANPDVRWIVLSAHIRDSYIDTAIQAGAIGYLSKREEPTAIVNAIRAAMKGEPSFSREVLERYNLRPGQERDLAAGTRGTRLASLTPREVQVLRLIGQGLQRAEIASMIHRSPKTIDVHRGRIMDKLDIHDRVELVRFCIREGIVSP